MSGLEQWILKAEGDYNTCLRLMTFEDSASFDAICFHAQQCAEKYLKAFMIEHKLEFKPRHDHAYLLSLILPIEPSFEFVRRELDFLNDYAVDIRYPGDFAVREEAQDAIRCMKVVRRFLRQKLNLEK